jgi:hypothetical protein
METENLTKLKKMTNYEEPSPYFSRLNDLLNSIDPNNADWDQIAAMYNLHNEMFPQIKEHSTFCEKCRSRVYTRLCRWLDKQIVIIENNKLNATRSAAVLDPVVPITEDLPKPKRGRKKKAEGDS